MRFHDHVVTLPPCLLAVRQVARLDEIFRACFITRYDNFLLENAEPKGSTCASLEQLADLIKSLGGDYKWMKDKEIEVR
eukprot:COSAG02_NODE_1264_length_13544_cov_71.926441_13_plen_79_part_00